MMVVCANAIQVDVVWEAVTSAQMSVGSIAKFPQFATHLLHRLLTRLHTRHCSHSCDHCTEMGRSTA